MPEMQFLMLLTHFIEVIRRIETIDGRVNDETDAEGIQQSH